MQACTTPVQRRHEGKLIADLAAVVCGIRPSLMLDYIPAHDARWAARLCQALNERMLGAPRALVAVVLGDCFFFLRPDLISVGGAAWQPVFLALAEEAGDLASSSVARIDPSSAQGLALASDAAALRKVIVRDTDSLVVHADAVCRHAQLPTSAGLLLGYPIVYAVRTADEGQALARALSSQSLVLCSATARLAAGKQETVSAFTVPLCLHESCSEACAAWSARAARALQAARGSGWNWTDVQVEERALAPRPVVL